MASDGDGWAQRPPQHRPLPHQYGTDADRLRPCECTESSLRSSSLRPGSCRDDALCGMVQSHSTRWCHAITSFNRHRSPLFRKYSSVRGWQWSHRASDNREGACPGFSSDDFGASRHSNIARHRGYYDALEAANKIIEVTRWLTWFASIAIVAQSPTSVEVEFLIEKTQLLDRLRDTLNERQRKVL